MASFERKLSNSFLFLRPFLIQAMTKVDPLKDPLHGTYPLNETGHHKDVLFFNRSPTIYGRRRGSGGRWPRQTSIQ